MKRSLVFVIAGAASFFFILLGQMPSGAHHDEQHARPVAVRDAGLDQRLNEQVPPHLTFLDESGRSVELIEFFGKQPILLILAYFDCPNLCPLVSEGLLRSLRALPFRIGEEFRVLTVSIDPRDTPKKARQTKQKVLQRYGGSGRLQGWDFLTGEKNSIEALARAVGFRYSFDAEQNQYAHAAGLVVLTPEGRVSRYFYGIEYAPKDLRLGLVEASAGAIGSPVDQLLLFCYHYDPSTGKYGLVIMNVLRLAGLGTVLGLGGYMLAMFGRDRRDHARSRGVA